MADAVSPADIHDADECERCGGEGFVSYMDSPDVWGEDCPSMLDHYVSCPECGGRGLVPHD